SLAFFRLAADGAGAPVRSVILGIDTFFFFGAGREARIAARHPELRRFLPDERLHEGRSDPADWLLSTPQLRDSCASLFRAFHPEASVSGSAVAYDFAPDGFLRLGGAPEPVHPPPPADLEAIVRQQLTSGFLNRAGVN